jgi:hypothetical protein
MRARSTAGRALTRSCPAASTSSSSASHSASKPPSRPKSARKHQGRSMTRNAMPDDRQLTLAAGRESRSRGSPADRLIIEYRDYECPYSRGRSMRSSKSNSSSAGTCGSRSGIFPGLDQLIAPDHPDRAGGIGTARRRPGVAYGVALVMRGSVVRVRKGVESSPCWRFPRAEGVAGGRS